MEAAAILALVERGLAIAGVLIAAGKSAGPAIYALAQVVSGARTGSVTEEDIARTEALLDAMLAEFNAPMK